MQDTEFDQYFGDAAMDEIETEATPAQGEEAGATTEEQQPAGQPEQEETGEKDGAAKDEGDEGDGYQQAIPRGRFNQVYKQLRDEQARNDELLAENKRLRGEKATPESKKPVDIPTLELDYMRALIEDREDDALNIRAQINEEIGRMVEERTVRKTIEQISARETQRLADIAADEVVAANPELNNDEGLLAELVEWRDFYILGKGMSPHEAIRAAAKRMFPEKTEQIAEPGAMMDERKATTVKRNIRENAQQPPAASGAAGERGVKVGLPERQEDYERLNDEERLALLQ